MNQATDMTVADIMAAHALQGILAGLEPTDLIKGVDENFRQKMCDESYDWAQAMLVAKAKSDAVGPNTFK